MTTYKVTELMERMTTDVRRFSMGNSVTIWIDSILCTENKYTVIVVRLNYAGNSEVVATVEGDKNLLLSVTPYYWDNPIEKELDESEKEPQLSNEEIQKQALENEANQHYQAGYAYACGYYD